jgi:hypothetical protein
MLAMLAGVLVLAPASAQQEQPAPGGIGISDTDGREFDRHDFNGLWSRLPDQFNLPSCPECRDPAGWPGYGFFGETPPRTPEGERRFLLNRPARGLELDSAEAGRRGLSTDSETIS